MKTRLVLLALFTVGITLVLAQDTESPPENASVPPEEAAAPPPAPVPLPVDQAPVKPRGDILTLKSGQVIEGFQVLRGTATDYVLEIIEGVTLNVPRRQVVSVDYDDYDPSRSPSAPEPTLIQGQRVSDKIQEKLDTDISVPPLAFEAADFVQVLEQINQRVEGVLVIDRSVRDLPPESRLWTVSTSPGMTLGALLRRDLLYAFPDLALIFRDDKAILMTKAAAAIPQEAPPEVETPPVAVPQLPVAPPDTEPPEVVEPPAAAPTP